MTGHNQQAIPIERISRLDNFGHSLTSASYLFRPTRSDQIAEVFEKARQSGLHVGLRGAGKSYGDAALSGGGVVIDLQRMNRVLKWNPESGVIVTEPGVTIEQVWRHTLEDGWWLPVTPGTMLPTLGGCLASNIHGKNNWKLGPIGEHVLEFDALMPNGEIVTCTPQEHKELFYAMISGMGMLGVFVSITLQLKKVYSGYLAVKAWAEPDLSRVLKGVDENKENDYIVGWVDSTARGRALGRGQVHQANYLEQGRDPQPSKSFHPSNQDLPQNIFGLVPRAVVWRILSLTMFNLGLKAGNTGKYFVSRRISHQKAYLQPLVAFTFLLDYVPNWERAYGRGGMIQYQSFLPKETAFDIYSEMLKLCEKRGLPSYLGVLKRHRPDDFLLSYAVDGFSLALDFKVTDRNRNRLRKLTADLNELALDGGGRFYFAKDSTLTSKVVREYLGAETVTKFKKLKSKCDPENLLQSDLYLRCFGS